MYRTEVHDYCELELAKIHIRHMWYFGDKETTIFRVIEYTIRNSIARIKFRKGSIHIPEFLTILEISWFEVARSHR